MRDGYRFEFGAFDKPDAPKAQALKPLEEAAEVFGANLVQNLRRQLTSIEATVGDAIDLLDESTGAVECDE